MRTSAVRSKSRFSLLLSLTLIIGLGAALLAFAPQLTPSGAAAATAHKRQTRTKKTRRAAPKSAAAQAAQPTEIKPASTANAWKLLGRPPVLSEEVGNALATTEQLREPAEAEEYDDPDEAAKYYRRKRIPEEEREIPVEKYLEAQEQMRAMPQFSTADNRFAASQNELRQTPEQQRLGQWTPLGPGNIGGRTRTIIINPQDPNIMYTAGVSGGVWKSVNAGQSWTPMSDLLAHISISILAFDPKDTNFNTIYAGTGEGYAIGSVNNVNITGGFRGLGIYKSSDGGVSWTRLPGTDNPNFFYINDLVVSSSDSQRIYAATETGVWRSLDGGVNWTRALNPTVPGGTATLIGGCMDLAIRTDQPTDTVFAACGTRTQSRIYRTTDGASDAAWGEVYTEPVMGRTALAIAPSNQNIIYALSTAISGTFSNGLHAVFRSMDNGAPGSWTARVRNTSPNKLNRAILSTPPAAVATDCRLGTVDSFGGQGFYDLALAVDPVDPERVWVGGIDIFRSDDGGANWGLAGYAYNFGVGSGASFLLGKTHPDQHVIVFHPQYNGASNQQLFIGNDGGLYRTDNARAKVGTSVTAPCNFNEGEVNWTNLNNGFAVTQFYHGTVSPDGKSYFGGSQDNGTSLGTDEGGPNNWKLIFGGDGGYGAFDFLTPSTLYASSQGANLGKSTDGGRSFSAARFGFTDAVLFIAPLALDPSDPKRIYIGGRGLNRTLDGATNWANLTGNLTATSVISALAIAPTDSNFGLAGFADGTIIRTSRALELAPLVTLAAPTEIARQPRTGFVSWVAFDPNNKLTAYATYSFFGGNHIYRTTDGGLTWTSIDGVGMGRLPDIPVHCLVVDPVNTMRLYVGTDLGVFASLDGGQSWAIENTGFANVITESLQIQVVNGETWLYAFTHGRGAFRVRVNSNACSYGITPQTRRFGVAGGDAVVNITANPATCAWQAASNVPWLEVAPNSGGNGNGSVSLKILANTALAARSGTVTVAGRSFSVLQEGRPDVDAPTLTITTPNMPTVNTTAGSLNLAGAVADNVRVTGVTWRTDRGLTGAGTLNTALTQWTAANVPLATGRNLITVTASDNAGNVSGPATITVNAMPASVLMTVAGTGVAGFSGEGGPAVAANLGTLDRIAFDRAGNLYNCEFSTQRVRRIGVDGRITLIAGVGTTGFSGDGGPAREARLNGPNGIVVDKDSNVYISDYFNHRIRKVTATTGVITTIAGTGTAGFGGDDGPAAAALLNFPENITIDAEDNIYVADSANHRIRKISTDGRITTVAGAGVSGFSGDGGPARSARLNTPLDAYVDTNGDLYISDAANYRIRKVTASDGVITTIAGTGLQGFSGDGGPARNAAVNNVYQLALDKANNIYFSDLGNSRLRRIAADGVITTIAGSGLSGFTPDGGGAVGARLGTLAGLALDPGGSVVFCDGSNVRIRKIVLAVSGDTAPPTVAITEPTTGGTFTSTTGLLALRGTASDNGVVATVRWSNDRGGNGFAFGTNNWTVPNIALATGLNNITVTAWDANGNLSSATLAVTSNPQQALLTFAGTGVGGFSGEGAPGPTAQLWQPIKMALDGNGNLLFTDSLNRRVRRISPAGIVSTVAGTGEVGSGGDGGPASEATVNLLAGITLDSAGNIYVTDNNARRVRRIGTDGKISTVAGTGVGDFGGDGGPATNAYLNGPQDVAVDARGNLYIADSFNNRVRKVDAATGVITTIVGNGNAAFSGDGGPAANAEISGPRGLVFDASGNLYLADVGNQRIRRINASDGVITTVAGTGAAGYNGDGLPATQTQLNLSAPAYLSLDPAGDLIIADRSNHRIRKLTFSSGLISTIAGTGVAGFSGDGSVAGAANLLFPTQALVDARGNLYICDNGNNRIRRTVAPSSLRTVASVSAASFNAATGLASDAIAAAFGVNLATATQAATTTPLPTTLAGTTLLVTDSLGVARLAPLFFVSGQQINFLTPNGTAPGAATITVTNGNGEIATGAVNIANVAPGVFTVNSNGQGLPAAVALRIRADGTQSFEAIVRFDAAQNRFVAVPIDLGAESDQVFLVLFGTGFRYHSGLASVTATVGGVAAPVNFAGAVTGLLGLDQANLRLGRSLAGRGEVEVLFTVDGKQANAVRVAIR